MQEMKKKQKGHFRIKLIKANHYKQLIYSFVIVVLVINRLFNRHMIRANSIKDLLFTLLIKWEVHLVIVLFQVHFHKRRRFNFKTQLKIQFNKFDKIITRQLWMLKAIKIVFYIISMVKWNHKNLYRWHHWVKQDIQLYYQIIHRLNNKDGRILREWDKRNSVKNPNKK